MMNPNRLFSKTPICWICKRPCTSGEKDDRPYYCCNEPEHGDTEVFYWDDFVGIHKFNPVCNCHDEACKCYSPAKCNKKSPKRWTAFKDPDRPGGFFNCARKKCKYMYQEAPQPSWLKDGGNQGDFLLMMQNSEAAVERNGGLDGDPMDIDTDETQLSGTTNSGKSAWASHHSQPFPQPSGLNSSVLGGSQFSTTPGLLSSTQYTDARQFQSPHPPRASPAPTWGYETPLSSPPSAQQEVQAVRYEPGPPLEFRMEGTFTFSPQPGR